MVRVTPVLARIPVIKFRKGGLSGASRPAAAAPSAPNAASAGSPAPAAAPAQVQSAAAMSTSAVPDVDLPLRYRRQPLSDEEIAYINGGGIV
ncbi:unnamed protein product [Spodoptera exigua]|uniref:28S ribosomal protein S36, mitochondrial n=1 Tax=Spodoptera exigua TaxID=7107 RepID=A0A835L923_SPOEX|nr:hypothetical protein HW555_002848 [Spodoptera exigua]CAH0691913.1 unnamed protein product [Spodoptera exigua]